MPVQETTAGSDIPTSASRLAEKSLVGGLPRRDLVLLPLLALLTVLLLLLASEGVTRLVWTEQDKDVCLFRDPTLGSRTKPNCESRVKSAEGPWVTNHYNDCGYRSSSSCKPVAAGTLRIAVIGASTSGGFLVPEPEMFTTRSAAALAQRCHRPVDFQDLGLPATPQEKIMLRIDEALALKPNLLVWPLVPFDLQDVSLEPVPLVPAPAEPVSSGFISRLRDLSLDSRAVLIAQHYLYQNLRFYLPTYVNHSDRADFLRVSMPPLWQRRLDYFERNVAVIADKARAAGVPFLLVLIPQRAQAALMTTGTMPDGVDPMALGRAMQAIADRHGAKFLDITSSFGHRHWTEDLFYPVDGHLAGGGNSILADDLVARLQGGDIPGFATCAAPSVRPGKR